MTFDQARYCVAVALTEHAKSFPKEPPELHYGEFLGWCNCILNNPENPMKWFLHIDLHYKLNVLPDFLQDHIIP